MSKVGQLVDPDQKRRGDDHVPGGLAELLEVFRRPPGVRHVLQHLLADHHIEATLGSPRGAQMSNSGYIRLAYSLQPRPAWTSPLISAALRPLGPSEVRWESTAPFRCHALPLLERSPTPSGSRTRSPSRRARRPARRTRAPIRRGQAPLFGRSVAQKRPRQLSGIRSTPMWTPSSSKPLSP